MNNSVQSTFRTTGKRAAHSQDVELALAVMCALQKPGEQLSVRTIAEVTGLSHNAPHLIEKRALRKLQTALADFRGQAALNLPQGFAA